MEMKLFDLVGQWKQVADMMLDPEVDQQTILDTLEGITGEIEIKADGYGTVIRKLEMESAMLKAKKDYLDKISKQIGKEIDGIDSHVEWMKDRVSGAMIEIGKENIKTERFEFKLKGTGGVGKLECTQDVPKEFKRTKTTIVEENDNDKIREYLKDHTVEWARVLPKKKKLEIKGV